MQFLLHVHVQELAAYKGKPGLSIKRRPQTTSHPQLNLVSPLSGCMCPLHMCTAVG